MSEVSGDIDDVEEVQWFLGVSPIRQLRSSSLHGASWIVEDTSEETIADVVEKLETLDKGLQEIDRQQNELQQKLISIQAKDSSDSEEVDSSDSEASVDPYPDDTDAIEDMIDDLDVIKLKVSGKRDELQDQKDQLDMVKMTVLRGPAFEVAQFVDRLDAPWLMFVKRTESARPRFVAKLFTAGPAYTPTGKLLHGSAEACRDAQSLEPFIHEFKKIHECVWEVVRLFGDGSFVEAGLMPPVGAFAVTSAHPHFGQRHSLAVISLLLKNGPINEVLRKMGNIKDVTWFSDSFLHANLQTIVFSLAVLEDRGVYHGNIKPSNLLVSDDGSQLLLGDFLPPEEMKQSLLQAAVGSQNMPANLCPELLQILRTRRTDWDWIRTQTNLYKNDVWCLGATFYALATRAEPTALRRSPAILKDCLIELEGRHEPFVDLLNRMLVWIAADRPTFLGLLSSADQSRIRTKSVQRGLLESLGLQGLAPIKERQLETPAPKKKKAEEEDSSDDGEEKNCCVC
ncbi:MAG: uncharacterized protein KVP18_003334 [Porospora cf. gigantea A]|uniref:uncharacterized protein n=1 Tax=Porospora cf. gigantea A TaxID=2853593 RepID=UPI00355A9D15|nr:MAG: hypothetical protein KVP18_003334 [Porospora cf. gigantea A]